MTDPLEDRARSAAAAVRSRAAERAERADGLASVVRRGRRPRPARVLAAVAVAAVAVPALVWLFTFAPTEVQFADEPPPQPPAPATDPTPPSTGTDPFAPAREQDAPASPGPAPATPAPTASPTGAPVQDEPAPGPTVPERGFATDEVASVDLPAVLPEMVDDGARPGPLLSQSATSAQLAAVRVAAHDDFDRVVLEFAGGSSSYRVTYVDPPVLSDGEGADVPVAGEAYLEVRLLSASGVAWDPDLEDGYRVTYDGPGRVTGPATAVTEVVRTGDFESTLTWVVGLDRQRPFAVSVLHDPLRLVVDIDTR